MIVAPKNVIDAEHIDQPAAPDAHAFATYRDAGPRML